MKILVTLGGTREPIDSIRFITNLSTGETGTAIADYLSHAGHDVVALCGEGSIAPKKAKVLRFETFSDLSQLLLDTLKTESFDAIIHLAAISDYSVEKVFVNGEAFEAPYSGKLDSQKHIQIHLKQNVKLIDQLAGYATGPKPFIIAFKLTNTEDTSYRISAVHSLLKNPDVDWVVHNDFLDMKAGEHVFTIYSREGILGTCSGRQELAKRFKTVLDKLVAKSKTEEASAGVTL